MTRPRLLDLFCGGGGCSKGYSLAGLDVVGVDFLRSPRPAPQVKMGRQPCGEEWHQPVGHFSDVDDWMTRDELREAIPPAYTEFIGTQLLAQLEAAA